MTEIHPTKKIAHSYSRAMVLFQVLFFFTSHNCMHPNLQSATSQVVRVSFPFVVETVFG